MKTSIFIGVLIGSTVFGWIGALVDHGNWFGIWSILLSTIGSFLGIWLGYKVYRNYF